MKTWQALQQAFVGWQMIVRGDEGWREHFRFSAAGLVTALVLFYAFSFLAVVLASLQVGVPNVQSFLNIMLVQTLWLVALVLALFGTRFALKDQGAILPVLVPGTYALIAYLILGSLVALVLGALLPVLWAGLVYLLFRLGRVAGGWTNGVSAAFAFLAVVLLVGLPMSLYMLGNVST